MSDTDMDQLGVWIVCYLDLCGQVIGYYVWYRRGSFGCRVGPLSGYRAYFQAQ